MSITYHRRCNQQSSNQQKFGPKFPAGATTDDKMDIVSGNAAMSDNTLPLIPAGVTLASLSPIWYHNWLALRQTFGAAIMVSLRTLGFKSADLQTSGLHHDTNVTENTTTVTTIWTSPTSRITDFTILQDKQIEFGDKQIMLHSMDGTTTTTTTTTMTPNTLYSQPGKTTAMLKWTLNMGRMSTSWLSHMLAEPWENTAHLTDPGAGNAYTR